MFHTTITNPETGRRNNVRAWTVKGREAYEILKAHGVKALSWHLLEDDGAVQEARETMDGDSARSNFALSIFENALDWGLGLACQRIINDCIRSAKRLPKSFTIGVNHKGDVFLICKDGRAIKVA